MTKYTVKVEGMKCPRCEAHVNEALKEAFGVKNIKVSRESKEAVIITDKELDAQKIEETIKETGFTYLGTTAEPYEKKGLFSK